MTVKADYDFNGNNIPFSFSIGEVNLLKFEFQGFKCRCDIFASSDIEVPIPPKAEMMASGYKKAYIISQPLARKLRMLYFRGGYISYVVRQYKHYYINTDISFDDYLKSFKSKTKSTLLRKVKKANASNNPVTFFRVFSSPDEMMEFLPLANAISKKSFQFQFLKQGLPENERYINDFLLRAKESRIFGFILYINNQPAAYNLCPVYGGDTMTYYYTGYDPAFSDYSPGTVLQFKTIEFACMMQQINRYDLCIGEGKHKELFSDECKYCGDIYYLPMNGKNLLLVLASAIHLTFMKMTKDVISSVANPAILKKWIRKIMSNTGKKTTDESERHQPDVD